MLVSIRIKTPWEYQVSAKPHRMRALPAGWAGQLEIEVAAAAIADGVAEARGTMSPELTARVVYYSRVLELHRTGMSLDDAIATADAELHDDSASGDDETEGAANNGGAGSGSHGAASHGNADIVDVAEAPPPKVTPPARRRKSAAA